MKSLRFGDLHFNATTTIQIAARAKAAGAPPATGASSGAKQRGTPAPGGVPHQFIAAIAQLVQAGTITAAVFQVSLR